MPKLYVVNRKKSVNTFAKFTLRELVLAKAIFTYETATWQFLTFSIAQTAYTSHNSDGAGNLLKGLILLYFMTVSPHGEIALDAQDSPLSLVLAFIANDFFYMD